MTFVERHAPWLVCLFKGHRLVNYRLFADSRGYYTGHFRFDCDRCGLKDAHTGWGRPCGNTAPKTGWNARP